MANILMHPRLMEVARNGDIEALYGLLGEDPSILENVENVAFIDTPLHWAVSDGHTCFVEEIINLKPSFILKLNQQGFSPLHLASTSRHVEIVKVLLKEERRLKKLMEAMNIVDDSLCTLKGKEKMTPLHCAAKAGSVAVLKVLLSNCPNSITALTVRKETALNLAVKYGEVEAFKVLVNWIEKHWYNDILRWKDQQGNTVLHLATSTGQYEIVEVMLHSSCSLLVRYTVQVNAMNNEGLTALDLLPNNPDQERMRTILSDVGAKKRQDMESQMVRVDSIGDIEALYGLHGEDPSILENVENIPFTDTPLHWAVSNGHTRFVEEIINLKPSFILKLNQEGFSPLHLASRYGHVEIVNVLLKEEWRLNKLMEAMNIGDDSLCTLKGKEKMTPLHCAAKAGSVAVLKVLLSKCPNSITALTVRKETALHLAVKYGQVEAFRVLVNWIEKHWFNDILGRKDQQGNTVLHLATSGRQHKIVEVMLNSSYSLLVRYAVRVNAMNNEGSTALDLLPNGPDQERVRTILSDVGAKKSQDLERQQPRAARICAKLKEWLPYKSSKIKHWFSYFKLKVDKDTPSESRNALLVIVVLIATATFQTGLTPPGGYWDNTSSNSTVDNNNDNDNDAFHFAGEPIWATYAPRAFKCVMLFNFVGFSLSLVLAYNLTQGYPLRVPLLVALIFMLLTYSWSTPIYFSNGYFNGPAAAGDDYILKPANVMLWVPAIVIIIIWTFTANWVRRIWWKFRCSRAK